MSSTICALATPPGAGGIAVVRVSGPEAYAVVGEIFTPRNPAKRVAEAKGYTAMLGHYHLRGEEMDETIALFFRAPHSYTGEDVIELSVHGGNAMAQGLLEALYLAGIGCEVTLVHRRDSLRAEQAVARRALENPRITPLWNSRVASFAGEEKLEALVLDDGRRIPVDAAFVAVGRTPDTALVRGQVDMDAQGFIVAGEDCRTSMPGVFVVGDARTKALRQVVTAAADGAMAASQCHKA